MRKNKYGLGSLQRSFCPELYVGCKKLKLICLYCGKAFTGGGINRLKQYLTQTKEEVK
jgi:hypothetical protein